MNKEKFSMFKSPSGFYFNKVNGFYVTVTKDIHPTGEIVWYNSISQDTNGTPLLEGTDFYSTKKQAVEAIYYVANHPEEYEIKQSDFYLKSIGK